MGMRTLSLRAWQTFVVDPLRGADRGQVETARGGHARGWEVAALLLFAGLCLSGLEYIAKSPGYRVVGEWVSWFGPHGAGDALVAWYEDPSEGRFRRLQHWALGNVLFLGVLPFIFCRWVLRLNAKQMGLGLGSWRDEGLAYLVFFAFMLPVLWWASTLPGFQSTYPFYKPAGDEALWPRFWAFEAMYVLQFLALEFFFRGVLVVVLARWLGSAALWVMVVPYVMLHFGKPGLETLGAFFAGAVLGLWALRSRSIWLGVAVHASVGVTMDLLALARTRGWG